MDSLLLMDLGMFLMIDGGGGVAVMVNVDRSVVRFIKWFMSGIKEIEGDV